MEKYEPIEIKVKKTKKYYCRVCLHRVYKKYKICSHCYREIDWKGDLN